MTPTIKLTKLVLRADGKYDCEVAIIGYYKGHVKTSIGSDIHKIGFTPYTKGQKLVLTVENEDLGEDLYALMDNIRDYIDDNRATMQATWDAIEDGTYVQKACTYEYCNFPECDHVCGKNPGEPMDN